MAGTVRFHRANAGANSSTLQVWARKLHDLLLLAGWTLEFANADAIGTGSAASPNFDKAPAINTSAGVVIYKMPLNGQVTPWFVRLEPRWGANVAGSFLSAQTGTGQVAGALQNPGSAVALTGGASATNANAELYVSAHPDALLVCLTGAEVTTSNWLMSVGRRIDDAGLTGDDLTTSLIGASAVTVTGPAGIDTLGSSISRSITRGESQAEKFLVWACPGASFSTYTQPLTTNRDGAETGLPLGPYLRSGGMGSPPRLWLIVADNDSVAGTEQLVFVDEADRRAIAAVSSSAMRTAGRLVFLQE